MGETFAQYIQNSQHLCASIGSTYDFSLVTFGGQTTIYPQWGAFSPQIFSSFGGEAADCSQKS